MKTTMMSQSTPFPDSEPVDQPCHEETEYGDNYQYVYHTAFENAAAGKIKRKSLVRSLRKGLVKRVKKLTKKLHTKHSADPLCELSASARIVQLYSIDNQMKVHSGPTQSCDRKVFNWLCDESPVSSQEFDIRARLYRASIN